MSCRAVSLKSLKLVPKALGREVGLLGFVPGSLSRLMRLGPLFFSWLMSEFQPLEHHMLQSSHSVEWLEVGMNACKKSVHQRSRLHSDWHILWTLPSLLPVSAFDFSKGLSHPDLMSQRPAYQGAVAFDRWVKQDTQKLKALVRNRIQVSCWIHTPVLRLTTLDSILKSRDITLLTKVHIDKAMVFPSSHVQMWELDHKEGWALKNWCFQIVALEKTLESPLDSKGIKPVNPKGSQPWIATGRTEAAASILWPPDVKSRLIWKDPDAGKDWRQEEKGATEAEVVGWHHWLDGCESEQTPGNGGGQRSLACCSPWGRKRLSDWTTLRLQALSMASCRLVTESGGTLGKSKVV